MNIADITPVTMIKNEETWIYYVLRDILDVFGRAIVLDTGSTDKTLELVKWIRDESGANVLILEKDCGDNPNLIGNGRNILRQLVRSEWMFLVDGDEIWTKKQLSELLKADVPDDKSVIMVGGRNVQDVNGNLKVRELANYDRLFRSNIRWQRTDYPFESYGLLDTVSTDVLHYVDSNIAFHWHVRHTKRSSKDSDAYFRSEKLNYFKYEGEYSDLPDDWLEKGNHKNHYYDQLI